MTRILLVVAILGALFAAACAPDAAYLGPTSTKHHKPTKADDGDDDDDSDSGDDDDDVATTEEEETLPTPAKKADAGPPPPAPFGGASSFASTAPDTDSSKHHLKVSNAGKDCMSCHGEGQGAPTFAVAGTLFRTKDATEGASDAEIRIVDAKGAELALVNTDSAGNFWLLSRTLKIPPGARVGVRDATGTKTMNTALSTGGCNQTSCHNSARPMFLQ